jgi:ribulose-phosphate 3-epimerase
MISNSGSRALIEVDGGVGLQNYTDLIKSGADVLVAGSSVFSAPNPIEAIKKLKTI